MPSPLNPVAKEPLSTFFADYPAEADKGNWDKGTGGWKQRWSSWHLLTPQDLS